MNQSRPRPTISGQVRCSDFVTYPYFNADYRVGWYASGQIVDEGITNWDAGRMRFFQMTWFDEGRRAYQTNSIFQVDLCVCFCTELRENRLRMSCGVY